MKRSKQFNYFTNGSDPKEKRKSNWKKTWKWIKTFLYVAVFGLTLTGCVQNFTIKTSSTVGNGFEIYTSEEEIAPKVTTFKVEKANIGEAKSDDSSSKQEFALLKQTNINYHTNDKGFQTGIIKQLKEQTEKAGGQYGQYNAYTSSVRIDFSQLTEEEKTALLQKLSEQGFSNQETPILKSTSDKYLYKSSTSTGYEKINAAEDIYYYLDSQGKGTIFDFISATNDKGEKTNTPQITKVDNVDSYSIINAGFGDPLASVYIAEDVAPLSADADEQAKLVNLQKANNAYNSDVLLTFYNFSFGPNSDFMKLVKEYNPSYTSVSQFIKSTKDYINLDINALKRVDPFSPSAAKEEERDKAYNDLVAFYNTKIANAKSYQVEIPNLVNIQGYLEKISQLVSSKPENWQATATSTISDLRTKWIESTREILVGRIPVQVYNLLLAYNTTMQNYLALTNYRVDSVSQNQIQFKTNENVDSDLSLRGDYPQKPITSWGQAWELGPFYGLLVYPLGALMQSIRRPMPDLNGWASIIAVIIAVIITRALTLGLTFRATMMQSLQEDLKTKKAAIEAKYKNFENNKQMKLRKQQEIAALHSKYNINPLDQLGQMLFQMPIFFAMWRVIQGIPEIKATFWLGINFSSTSYQELFSGNWVYIWILAAVIIVQLASQLLPQWLNKRRMKERATIAEIEALKKSERTQRMMMIVFTVITVFFTAGVQVYWMFGGLWQIGQTLALHKVKKTRWFKDKYSKKALKNN
ncbi:membrane protein insertase YidC [Mycoplasma buteonis]|uniref:membrane protein insertase YidC n=1 Tax=Mycoplasma buteonis TaxID=171280 RepID=UPI00056B576B|nr:membrane protein insertase YidC [Mycoplasma buteonis]